MVQLVLESTSNIDDGNSPSWLMVVKLGMLVISPSWLMAVKLGMLDRSS